MKSISLFTRSIMVLMCGFLLGACAATPPPTAQATSTAISMPTPTPYVPPPTLTPPPLGPVPQNCPLGPTPQQVFSDLGPFVLGHAPLWVSGFDGPHATVRLSPYDDYTQYGWTSKMIWRAQASYTHPITVRGGNLRTGTPLWFQMGEQDPSMAPILNPQEQRSELTTDWVEWGSYVYIPMAGCYYIEAAWPGGHWRITFAAGGNGF